MRDAHGPQAHDTLGNLDKSMQLAYKVSNGGTDFSPWTMYRNGTYRQYLPGSDTAVESSGPSSGGGIAPSPSAGGDDSGGLGWASCRVRLPQQIPATWRVSTRRA